MTQLSDKWAKLDNLGSLKALLISVHECNLLQLKQALAKKQLSSSDSLAHFDILDSRPNSSERQDVQLYTSMISAGWDHGRTARAPSSLEASLGVDAIGDDDDLSHVYLPNFKQL